MAANCETVVRSALNLHPGSAGVVCAAVKALRVAVQFFGAVNLGRRKELCAAVYGAMERFPDVAAVQVCPCMRSLGLLGVPWPCLQL